MKSIKYYLLLAATLIALLPVCYSQTSKYEIESFQSTYSALTDYQSLGILEQGIPLWEHEFELNFPFPFFDSSYTRMIYAYDGWGSFTDDQDESLLMMSYKWTWENFKDTSNITSDVRFSHLSSNGMQAFVIEYYNARLFADPFVDSLNTYLNFQYWFFENGNLEVHFGDIHMDDTPIYSPGNGLYCYSQNTGIDTNEVCGPVMGIGDPYNEEEALGLEGAYNDFEIYPNQYGYLTVLPPTGWVIRFKPKTVSTQDIHDKFEDLPIFPNPVINYIHLPESGGQVIITDSVGKRVFASTHVDEDLDIAALTPGLYILSLWSGNTLRTGKFLKL